MAHRGGRAGGGSQFRWMLMPAMGFLAVMVGFPLGYTIWLSGQAYRFGGAAHWAGMLNYRRLLGDGEFWNGLAITFGLYVLAITAQLLLGIYLALLLDRVRRFRQLLRTLLVSPFVMPPVVVGMMWLVILDPTLGVANWFLAQLGIAPSLWLASPVWVIATVAMIDTWQWTPFVALLVLAGLQTLPADVFESAAIDGARGFALFRRITLPLLVPSIVSATILRTVDLLRFFDVIYITTQGGPGNASETLNIYAFKQGFVFFDIGYAAALMLTLTAIVLVVVATLARVRKGVAAWS